MKSEKEHEEEKRLKEQIDAINAVDRKKEIVENQILRVLEMQASPTEATRIVIDNGQSVHNSLFVNEETAQRIYDVLYTSLTTKREKLITEAARLIAAQ